MDDPIGSSSLDGDDVGCILEDERTPTWLQEDVRHGKCR
jgi:hypothetical protein